MNKSKVSIVTVVYNGQDTIEYTIKSVLHQSYTNIEYIIIDGESTDDTLQIIDKYEDEISYLLSEPDMGIYDAMNKGVKVASGDWIYFLNSGDCLYEKHTIRDIFMQNNLDGIDFIYGDNEMNYSYFKRIYKAKLLKDLWKGMVFSHQAFFARTSLMKDNNFDLKFKYAADYNFIYAEYLKSKGSNFYKCPMLVASVKAEGYSEINAKDTIRERLNIAQNLTRRGIQLKLNYIHAWLKITITNYVKNMLPPRIVQVITKAKYLLG